MDPAECWEYLELVTGRKINIRICKYVNMYINHKLSKYLESEKKNLQNSKHNKSTTNNLN